MEKQVIARINGTEIFAETTGEGEILVPIKPICNVIGVDYSAQYTKLKEDDILSSVIVLSTTTGADAKQYQMVSLPLMYVYGWLFTINPKNVDPKVKETVSKYRMECYKTLYEHFTGKMKKTIEANQAEIKLLDDLRKAIEKKKEASHQIKEIEKSLDELRSERLNPQPSLFD